MRFRIVTIQFLIGLAAAPIWTLCEGVKAGCATRVLLVWGALVGVPVLLMGLAEWRVKNPTARAWATVSCAAVAVMGYPVAIPISFLVMSLTTFREIR